MANQREGPAQTDANAVLRSVAELAGQALACTDAYKVREYLTRIAQLALSAKAPPAPKTAPPAPPPPEPPVYSGPERRRPQPEMPSGGYIETREYAGPERRRAPLFGGGADSPAEPGVRTLLIVDSNAEDRAQLARIFSPGYDIIETDSGEKALELAEANSQRLGAILLSLELSDTDGLEVLRRRRSVDCLRRVPVLVISDGQTADDYMSALRLGARDYLTKPFIPQLIAARVENVAGMNLRSDLMRNEARNLKVRAETDDLTGLLNKATGHRLIRQAVALSGDTLYAAAMLNINGLEAIRAASGQTVADHIAKTVAGGITSHFRRSDVICRASADTFIIFLKNVPDADLVRSKLEVLCYDLKFRPSGVMPTNVSLTTAFVMGRGPTDSRELLLRAEEALFRAMNPDGQELSGSSALSRQLLLIGGGEEIRNTLRQLLPESCGLICVPSVQALDFAAPPWEDGVTAVICADVSGEDGGTAHIWRALEELPWAAGRPKLAICRETCMSQYIEASGGGASEMITAPVDVDQFNEVMNRLFTEPDSRSDKKVI